MAPKSLPLARIVSAIHEIRGHRVMLDCDLAALYGVSTSRLNEQVKRNQDRFPTDFMFRLTAGEASTLKSQFATSNAGRGGRRKLPNVFTEHGAVMCSSIAIRPQRLGCWKLGGVALELRQRVRGDCLGASR